MDQQKIYNVEGESEVFKLATASAQATFKFFWREQSWEARRIIKSLDLAAVKVAFALDTAGPNVPASENMWITNIEFDGQSITGVLMNEPQWVGSLAATDHVTVPLTALNDWMYVQEGHVYGGFTVDALRSRMSAADLENHDCAWGLDFGQVGYVEIVPAPKGQAPWLLSRSLDSTSDQELLAELERTEHPMAVNMRGKVEEAIREHPQMTSDVDAHGWLLLHREVLAGNYSVVLSLLRNGANPLTPNSNGHTALALAQMAGWPAIAELLEGNDRAYQGVVEARGIPLLPFGLAMSGVALVWLYFLAVEPLRGIGHSHNIAAANVWMFVGAVLLLGLGIISCSGTWYSRLRLRTPQTGKSRALDLVALLIGLVLAFVLHDQVVGRLTGL